MGDQEQQRRPEDIDPIQPIDDWIDRRRYPLAYAFMKNVTGSCIDAKALMAIRRRPYLLTKQMAEIIMARAARVVTNEVLRRISSDNWDHVWMIPLECEVRSTREEGPDDAWAMVMLYSDVFGRKDGWFVRIGTARTILGLRDEYGDPFRDYPPDVKALERILQGFVEEIMASIPMEMMARYAGK